MPMGEQHRLAYVTEPEVDRLSVYVGTVWIEYEADESEHLKHAGRPKKSSDAESTWRRAVE